MRLTPKKKYRRGPARGTVRETTIHPRAALGSRLFRRAWPAAPVAATAQMEAQTNANAAATAQAEAEANLVQSERLRLSLMAKGILENPLGNLETAALLSLRAMKSEYIPQSDIALGEALPRLYTLQAFLGHLCRVWHSPQMVKLFLLPALIKLYGFGTQIIVILCS